MQIRKRNGRAVLWRTSWVPKGAEGNSHGYRTEKYVGSLPLAATELPVELAAKLNLEEKDLLKARILEPARRAEAERERAAAAHEADPVWRIEDALRLLDEALTRSHESHEAHGSPVSSELLARLHDAIARWPARPARRAPLSGSARSEPNVLQPVIAAMEHAASAVRAGALGAPTAGKVRTTPAYHAWSAISAHVLDSKREDTLLRALQDAGVVKRRGAG